MKSRCLVPLCMLLWVATACAQSPEALNYQAVARAANGNVLSKQFVSVEISIRDGSPSATIVYQETDTATTNQFGLFSIPVGRGVVQVGTSLGAINWTTGNKYMQTAFDPAGGGNYILMGVTELLSVPYALYAQNSANGCSTVNQVLKSTGTGATCSEIIDIGTAVGIGIGTPVNQLDVLSSTASINTISGYNLGTVSGTGWNPNTGFAGVYGAGANGSVQYQAGVFGYLVGGGHNSAGVVGAYSGTIFGGLGYVDNNGYQWGVYSNYNSLFNAPVNIVDGTQANGKVFTSDANGLGSWKYLSAIDTGIINGTANYLAKFTSANVVHNSPLYSNALQLALGQTTFHGAFAIGSAPDSIQLYMSEKGAPTVYGTGRIEYNGTTDAERVGFLSTTINSVSNVTGTGVEGAGCAIGTQGFGENAVTTAGTLVEGVEGDSYGSGTYSVGMAGYGANYSGAPANCYGVYGYASGGTTNYGMYSDGNMRVNGSISKASGTFEIDHPLDPTNKYLYHSFVESPDMMNIYNGNITTGANGIAVVSLPNYFDTLNKDFRYQLTVMGTFAQAIISKKIVNNAFEIKTSLPNVEVSWMVTGVRKDAWANAHRVVVEVDKAPHDKGKYLHPIEAGKPDAGRIGGDLKKHERTGAEISGGATK